MFFATRHAALIKSRIRGVSLYLSPLPTPCPMFDTYLSSFLFSPCAPRAAGFGCCCCCLATGCNWYLSCLLILYMCAASLRPPAVDDDAGEAPCACDFAWTSATARQRKQHRLQSDISFYGLLSFIWPVSCDFMRDIL